MHSLSRVPRLSLLISLVSVIYLFTSAVAEQHDLLHKRYISRASVSLDKRQSFTSARFTEYEAGLGACGGYNTDSDYIVAINVPQYGDGELCGETITVSYEGRIAHAQIVDECEKCPYGALDLTPSLFSFLSGDGVGPGVLYGSWSFGSGDPITSTPPPPPPTSSHSSSIHFSSTSARTTSSISKHSTSESSSSSSFDSSTTLLPPSTMASSISTTASLSAIAATATSSSIISALDEMNQAYMQIAHILMTSVSADA